MTEISVQRALTELKMLDKRIGKVTQDLCAVGVVIGGKVANIGSNGFAGLTEKEVEKDIQAKYQKAKDLIAYRNKLKSAVVGSNSTTEIDVGGEKMTVAEAIERKNSIAYDKNLKARMGEMLGHVVQRIEQHNVQLRNDANTRFPVTEDMKEEPDKIKKIEDMRKFYVNENEAKLIDPLEVAKVLDKEDERINKFETDVDVILSESNARTMIEVL